MRRYFTSINTQTRTKIAKKTHNSNDINVFLARRGNYVSIIMNFGYSKNILSTFS